MDAVKLDKLREKYSNDNSIESQDPADNRVPYAGLPTLLGMPHKPELEGIDIALIGVPFDLGVYNRAGARFGPRAIRNVSLFGSLRMSAMYLLKIATTLMRESAILKSTIIR